MDNRVRLVYQGVTEIVGSPDTALLILTDKDKARQLSIICDKHMEREFILRDTKQAFTQNLLPEVLSQLISLHANTTYELCITSIDDGKYLASLKDTLNLTNTPIRVSDGILFANITRSPIYIDKELFLHQSIPFQEGNTKMAIPLNTLNDVMLNKALEKAINTENYKMAAYVKQEIERRKKQSENQ